MWESAQRRNKNTGLQIEVHFVSLHLGEGYQYSAHVGRTVMAHG